MPPRTGPPPPGVPDIRGPMPPVSGMPMQRPGMGWERPPGKCTVVTVISRSMADFCLKRQCLLVLVVLVYGVFHVSGGILNDFFKTMHVLFLSCGSPRKTEFGGF